MWTAALVNMLSGMHDDVIRLFDDVSVVSVSK